MTMVIREETAADFGPLHDFVRQAFLTAPVSAGDEQDFVDRLRASSDYIPPLALVAEDGVGVAGHIMLTRAHLDNSDVLLLAPLCVELSRRGQGIGAALIEEGFRRARQMGFAAVFLLGAPAYYARFGFHPALETFGITNPHDFPAPYFQACELLPGALAGGGTFSCGTPE